MGDLKISEAFQECVYITITATGAAATGLSPTCTAVKISDNTRTALTVQEVGSGWYRVTDLASAIAVAGSYGCEWAVAGAYTIYGTPKVYKVGGGDVQAIYDLIKATGAGDAAAILVDTGTTLPGLIAALNDLAQSDILDDATAFSGASIAAILADVTAINGDAMRGTNGAALASVWTAALATALAAYTAVRGGYLDELAAANLPTDVANIATAIAALNDLAQSDILDDATAFSGASIAAILADVTGINGDVMRGTDGAALASAWTAALATALGSYTAVRAGYLDELAAANLPTDIANLNTILTEAKLRAFKRSYGFVTQSDSVSSASEENLTAPGTVTVTFPSGAALLEAKVIAQLKASNQSEAEHNIGVTLQKNVAAAGWADVVDLTANPPLTLPEVDAAGDSLTLVETLTVATGNSVQFRFQVDSDNAGEVHYTSTFILVVEWDFHD